MPKRTYQPSKKRRSRQGFLSRSKNVLARRRQKGRKKLSPV